MEQHAESQIASQPKFRLNSKGFFLTWPQCHATKEECLAMLQSKGPIEKYIVCREEHKDGTPHLHAFVKYEQAKNFKTPNCFDLGTNHGNYQVAKSYYAVAKYVRKGQDYIEHGMDAKAEEEQRANHKKVLGAQLMQAKTNADIQSIVESESSMIFGLHKTMQDIREYRNLTVQQKEHEHARGIWIQGPPGCGKSHLSRKGPWLNPGETVYLKPQNKWWDLYQTERVVVLEDLDMAGGQTLGHYLKIWSDKWPFAAEAKGSVVKPEFDYFIVTSNYSIEEIFGPDTADSAKVQKQKQVLVEAIKRRFLLINMNTKEQGEYLINSDIQDLPLPGQTLTFPVLLSPTLIKTTDPTKRRKLPSPTRPPECMDPKDNYQLKLTSMLGKRENSKSPGKLIQTVEVDSSDELMLESVDLE